VLPKKQKGGRKRVHHREEKLTQRGFKDQGQTGRTEVNKGERNPVGGIIEGKGGFLGGDTVKNYGPGERNKNKPLSRAGTANLRKNFMKPQNAKKK